ncbi:ScyD/ScyE family protein [Motilibacter aurantiacus]|uniref:ScyD/ScyE family protein n=1 Tax=Motilibacter aurantiacus TaxID=2714955 RepID=UPI00140A628A|nr:ScyD/ScyE family protein [Motilibacter aurantiacus]NHC47377.1 ScyD/ScyE family protein [Motilibacter aurantiacus]
MTYRHRKAAIATISALSALAAVTGTAASAAAEDEPQAPWADHEVVLGGLDNPRQISWDGRGEMYVAEAGRGGDECIGEGETATCLGETGSIIRIKRPEKTVNGTPDRVIDGIVSVAGRDGSGAVGVDGVAAINSKVWFATTFAPPEITPAPFAPQLGKLFSGHGSSGNYKQLADVTAYEVANDPDGDGVESNPYAVLAQANRTLVVDAAGNTVLSVSPAGKVTTFAVIPEYAPGLDSVPTSIAQDAAGNVYVGDLGGEVPGNASVRKYSPTGTLLQTYGGFTTITGVAVGADGSIYAAELFGGSHAFPGQVTKLAPNGTRTVAAVPFAAGVAVSPNGDVYTSAFGIATAEGMGLPGSDGAVWRLKPAAFTTAPTGTPTPTGTDAPEAARVLSIG